MWHRLYCWASAIQHAVAPERERITRWEKAALNAMKAQDYRVAHPMKDQVLLRAVEHVYHHAKQEKLPKVIVYKQDVPNAGFIHTGTVIISTGLLEKLEPKEVEAVIAHELGHQMQGSVNLVVRFGALAAILAGASHLTRYLVGDEPTSALYRAMSGKQTQEGKASVTADDSKKSAYHYFEVAGLFTLAAQFLGYVASIPLGYFSRHQELDADRRAAEITNDPDALISSLDKLETYKRTFRHGQFAETNSMFLQHTPHSKLPEKKEADTLYNQLQRQRASHPPHNVRVAQLEQLKRQKSLSQRERLQQESKPLVLERH